MSSLNENIARDIEKVKQLERQNMARNAQERKKKESINTRRKIIIGGLVLKYFPEIQGLTPQRTEAKNSTEFAPLANYLDILASDKEFVAQLKAHLHIGSTNGI